jgi:hypothetical protein
MPDPVEAEADFSPGGAPVPIAFVYSLSEAAVLVCTLRAYGIFAFAFDYGTVSVAPPWMVALGGLRIVIPDSQRDEAVALLYEIDEGWTQPPRPYAPEPWFDLLLTIFVGFFAGMPPMPRARGLYAWRRRQAGSGSGAR